MRSESARHDAQQKLQEVSQRCFESLIAARKNYIQRECEKAIHSDNFLKGKLCLYFAANTHYNAHRGGKKIAGPLLSPAATGIPALRAHILEAAAPKMVSALQNHVDSDVTAFLHGINMLVSPANLRDYKGVPDMVRGKKQRVRPFNESYQQLVEDAVEDEIITHLTNSQQDFVNAPSSVLEEKKRWPH